MADRLFRAAPAATLRVQPLDDFTAIYHRAAGITHLVTAPVPEILALLHQPLSEADLFAQLDAHYDLAERSADALAMRLEELVAVGLVSIE